jgi:membrane AbrB-like protein
VAAATASPLELLELIAAAVTVSLLLRLMKFPASWMFGAMIGSSVLHGMGYVEGGLPQWVRGVALVGIGALIGTRFARMKTKTLLGHVNAGLGSFAIAIAISAVFVAIIVLTTHVRIADIIVAFAPGAMDAMLALALTLHIDPIFVGAHHLSRFVFVTIATPGIVHLFGRPQEGLAPRCPGHAPRRNRGHQQRDQHIVTGERQAEEAPLHLVATHDFDLVEALQKAAGAAEISDRPGAIGRSLPKPPFDAGVISTERGVDERRQRQDRKARQQKRPRRALRRCERKERRERHGKIIGVALLEAEWTGQDFQHQLEEPGARQGRCRNDRDR